MYVKKRSYQSRATDAYWELLSYMAHLCESPISRICRQIVSFFPAGVGTQDVFDILCMELVEEQDLNSEFNLVENSYDPRLEHYYDWVELLVYYGAPKSRKYLYEVYGNDAYEPIFKDVQEKFEKKWITLSTKFNHTFREMENMIYKKSYNDVDDFLKNKYYALKEGYIVFNELGPQKFARNLMNTEYISGKSITWNMNPYIVQLTDDTKMGIMVKHDYDHMMVYRNCLI